MNPKAARLALAGYYPLLRVTLVATYWVFARRTPAGYEACHMVSGFRASGPTTATILATTSDQSRDWSEVPDDVLNTMYAGIFGGAP